MWETFHKEGFAPFVDDYLRRWIHQCVLPLSHLHCHYTFLQLISTCSCRDQRVTLEATSQPVRIVGITPDHGLLRTIPINVDRMGNEVFGGGAALSGKPEYIDLQPDGNRFDLMKGMLYAR